MNTTDVRPSHQAMRRIEDHVRKNTCLCGCGRPMWRRGLSRACHYEMELQLEQLPDDDSRQAYLDKLARKGLYLAKWLVRSIRRRSSVFAQLAQESLAPPLAPNTGSSNSLEVSEHPGSRSAVG